jgi:hypothetical protein
MKLSDTIEMMTSEDYKERFKAEFYQLMIRINGLDKMLKDYKAGTLPFVPTCDYELLFTQLYNMKCYACDLITRASKENITLECKYFDFSWLNNNVEL